MIEGEKMIWAAVFAREFDAGKCPASLRAPDRKEEMVAWTTELAVCAAEEAGLVVQLVREIRPRMVKKFGGCGGRVEEFITMLDEMARTWREVE